MEGQNGHGTQNFGSKAVANGAGDKVGNAPPRIPITHVMEGITLNAEIASMEN